MDALKLIHLASSHKPVTWVLIGVAAVAVVWVVCGKSVPYDLGVSARKSSATLGMEDDDSIGGWIGELRTVDPLAKDRITLS